MPTYSFLAVDWGTTNLRAWVVGADGEVTAGRDFPLGVSRLAPGEAALRLDDTVRPSLQADALPAILCGMIGSNLGWELVPYFDCPADLKTLSSGMRRVAADGPPVFIVPGLRCRRPDGGPDVMRGEEVQILGWAAGAPERREGSKLICHPGTHAKWVRLEDGRIDRFVTAMTGELFDVLRRHSVLKAPDGIAARRDDAAFDEGVRTAGDGAALASRLFTARARVAGGDMDPAVVESYLSGVLIGADVAATPALLGARADEPVTLIGDEALCRHYERALRARGVAVTAYDGDAAALSGLTALYETERAR
jgi:2-dehydro-3-deoxygalactonokinase